MYWRAHTQELGDHIHVRLFVAETQNRTFAGIGQLTMRRPEWDDLRKRLDLQVTHREGTAEKVIGADRLARAPRPEEPAQ